MQTILVGTRATTMSADLLGARYRDIDRKVLRGRTADETLVLLVIGVPELQLMKCPPIFLLLF
jgi:hypothetical protein